MPLPKSSLHHHAVKDIVVGFFCFRILVDFDLIGVGSEWSRILVEKELSGDGIEWRRN